MFGNPGPKSSGATSVDTLIGRQTEILGDVRFSGGLHVDGKIKGKVLAQSDKAASLSVSESGSVEGDVRVPNVVLNGAVIGDVHASEKLTLAAKARVTGNVYYRIIEMEGGAMVNGQMVHEANEQPGAHLSKEPSGSELDALREARRVKNVAGT
ncbi:MAG TPA: polymer-forming cytoskeletal protein [Solimonas sp.]|nr:polymer-forming cytoskeletal protein [Solimonas sp.]